MQYSVRIKKVLGMMWTQKSKEVQTMNKRQRKKQFKKIHGMNPRDYFMKSENAPNAVIFFVNSSKMIRRLCKMDGETWEICREWWGQSNE